MSPRKDHESAKFWRYLTNIWTLLFFILIIDDFIHHGAYEVLIGPAAAIYTACLTIYSAEKEFERWQFYFIGKHPGEVYVALWTVLLFGIFAADIVTGSDYKVSPEIIATYIVVLGVLAITKKSKAIFKERCEPRE
ncbi:MAG: hypothetical protein V4465_01775 [Patescibacteria group bacterium]